jgi:hypothetical protein
MFSEHEFEPDGFSKAELSILEGDFRTGGGSDYWRFDDF